MIANRISRPSPNFNARPASAAVSAIVLHADADRRVETTLEYITQRASRVSYHVVVSRTGNVFDIVDPRRRAWHAGVSALEGRPDCNDYSVGVCLANVNDGREPYPERQLLVAAEVCALLMRQFPAITLERITTHAIVALPPGRKTDPAPPSFELAPFRLRVQRASDAQLLAAHARHGFPRSERS
jgi:N-acetyl-anhydromuramyl-L-alanine amidase AmpD